MVSAVTALLVAFVVTIILTPFVRALALRAGVVDAPGGRRVHTQLTPRLGGVALFIGFFSPLAVMALWGTDTTDRFFSQPGQVLGLAVGASLVAGVGAIDDVKGLGAWRKLLAQAVAATVAYSFGYRIHAVNIPGFGDVELGVLAFPITLFWFLGVINALNLIDGLDGLAAGIAFFASITNFVIAYSNGVFVVAMLSASLAGALLGFLRYNFNPAKIFMGDSGSMFLGFVLAATSLVGATTKSSTAVAILAPLVALGVPIFDTMLTMIRRTLAGQPVFSADRGHIHHRLLDLGLTHRRVVLSLYLSSILLAFAAVGIAFGRSWQLGGALALAGAVLFTLVRASGAFQGSQRPSPAELERAAALRTLHKSIRKTIAVLDRAHNRPAIDRCLVELGSDARLLSGLSLRPLGAEESAATSPSASDLVFVLHSSERVHALEVQLSPALKDIQADVRELLTPVAQACERALRRSATRSSHPQLIVAR